ncbi:MAG: hypothetical protein ABFD64_10675 [Armatimonadota bacterium]
MRKPVAVQRRDYLATTGPTIFGIKRMDKVQSPRGELFTFLGVKDGEVYMERDDKTKGEPFMIIDSSDFSSWQKK